MSVFTSSLPSLTHLELLDPFLVRQPAWIAFFASHPSLETFKISQSPRFDIECMLSLKKHCAPTLTSLRLREIGGFDENLQELDIADPGDVNESTADTLLRVLVAILKTLRVLDVSRHALLTDRVFQEGLDGARNVEQLVVQNVPLLTDLGLAGFFGGWSNPPLHRVDLGRNHELRSEALVALLKRSGEGLEELAINGWDEVGTEALVMVGRLAGELRLDVGWVREVDDFVVKAWLEGVEEESGSKRKKAGVVGCMRLREVKVWGCNKITAKRPKKKGVIIHASPHKVSFQDLVLDDDFDIDDLSKFCQLFFQERLGFCLAWLKDALIEALAMSGPAGTSANVGKIDNRFPILGGWIFNRRHNSPISNEAWWYLMKLLEFPANAENRLVRLCNSYDDIIGFLSFIAFDHMPTPSFCCSKDPAQNAMGRAARKHLSLSGVIVVDMITTNQLGVALPNPCPNLRMRAKKPGCIVWSEIEFRGHIFGALKNEPDSFTEAFLRELRTRPDLFQVVTRSETDPPRKVGAFGDGPDAALPYLRMRNFEAPPSGNISDADRGPWIVKYSAVNRLYGTDDALPGYLTELNRRTRKKGEGVSFFWFLTFPVKYFVILDTVPGRPVSVLARNVAWAALQAGGYAEGEYDPRKYARASDTLFEKCAKERLSWMPKTWPGWSITKMGDSPKNEPRYRSASTPLADKKQSCIFM